MKAKDQLETSRWKHRLICILIHFFLATNMKSLTSGSEEPESSKNIFHTMKDANVLWCFASISLCSYLEIVLNRGTTTNAIQNKVDQNFYFFLRHQSFVSVQMCIKNNWNNGLLSKYFLLFGCVWNALFKKRDTALIDLRSCLFQSEQKKYSIKKKQSTLVPWQLKIVWFVRS